MAEGPESEVLPAEAQCRGWTLPHLFLCLRVPFVASPYTLICFLETLAFREEGPKLAVPRTREEAGLSYNVLGTAILSPTDWPSLLPKY